MTEIEAAFISGAQRQASLRHHRQVPEHRIWGQSTALNRLYTSSNDGIDEQVAFSSSVNFAMNPESDEARELTARLGLSEEQHQATLATCFSRGGME